MFNKDECNFESYVLLLKKILKTNKYSDYKDALYLDEFIVLRHDIEFSIERAYNLSLVEDRFNVKSSYFVQITSNAYNAFSKKNSEMLKDMIKNGHNIGLHYHRNDQIDLEIIKEEIIYESTILSKLLNFDVDRYSFHRPLKIMLDENIIIPGLINTYSNHFFSSTGNPDNLRNTDPRYISDSNHGWKYGDPFSDDLINFKKVQLLVHPMSWTKNGSNHLDCFREIIKEKESEFINTIENEWKIFHLIKGDLK